MLKFGRVLVYVPKNGVPAAVADIGPKCLLSAKPEQATAATKRKEKALNKKAVHSKSFVQNIFRGIVEAEQPFPYPEVLTEEQRELLEMVVPPTEDFMQNMNDPLKNDALETVPEETVQVSEKISLQ